MIARFGDLVIGKWGARYRGAVFPCSIGRGGIGVKGGEGDGITPKGTFQICGIGFRADRLAPPNCSIPSHPTGPQVIWSDDPKDPDYNHGLTATNHPFSHERLFRADPLYNLFAILNFNWPVAVPGKGSAIFLHIWRAPRHPTEGCVAFSPAVFRFILQSWTADNRVVIR